MRGALSRKASYFLCDGEVYGAKWLQWSPNTQSTVVPLKCVNCQRADLKNGEHDWSHNCSARVTCTGVTQGNDATYDVQKEKCKGKQKRGEWHQGPW